MPHTTILTVLLSTLLILTPSARAQQGRLHLTTSPLPILLTTQPGGSVSTPLRVKNDGREEEHLTVGLMTFDADDETGRPRLIDPQPDDPSLDWISFSEQDFHIQPGQWKTITATIDVPEDASLSRYYAVTFSRSEPASPGEDQTVVIGATAILILLDIDTPDAIRSLEVLEFSVDRPWYEFLPAAFNIRLKNSGNVHIAPAGNIFISKKNTSDIAILPVNESGGNILPDSTRAFTTSWTDGFPVYSGEGEGQTLTWDFSQAHKLRWGKHTATMLLVYDDGTRDIPIEGTVSFWVVPWRILAVFAVNTIIVISFFALVGYLLMRRRARKKAARGGQAEPS